jgi:methyl-accepting chemotaxis protein
VAFRRELVRLSQTEGTPAARAFGDNDANRKVRSALNEQLAALNKAYEGHTESAKSEAATIQQSNQYMLIGLALVSVVLVVAGFLFVIRGLLRPLAAFRNAMALVAQGRLDVEMPSVERKKKVASIVSDIATASGDQAKGLEQINKALTQLDEVTQQNSALVEENAATAQSLEMQASTMKEGVEFFQIEGKAVAKLPHSPPAELRLHPAATQRAA